MAEPTDPNELTQDVSAMLNDAVRRMEEIEAKLSSGEPVDDRELEVLAHELAGKIEDARARIEEAVGPLRREVVRDMMKDEMSPEEYERWLKDEPAMLEFREQWHREKPLRDQLQVPIENTETKGGEA